MEGSDRGLLDDATNAFGLAVGPGVIRFVEAVLDAVLVEDAFSDATLGPSHKPVIKRFLRPINISTVSPAAATAKCVDDPTQHTTIAHSRLPAHIGRKQRLDLGPLRFKKP